jgi:hypothetical protein
MPCSLRVPRLALIEFWEWGGSTPLFLRRDDDDNDDCVPSEGSFVFLPFFEIVLELPFQCILIILLFFTAPAPPCKLHLTAECHTHTHVHARTHTHNYYECNLCSVAIFKTWQQFIKALRLLPQPNAVSIDTASPTCFCMVQVCHRQGEQNDSYIKLLFVGSWSLAAPEGGAPVPKHGADAPVMLFE